jgi:hypothetical protein
LTLAEALETTKIHSVMGILNGQAITATRPFRSPHHTISDAGLVGGGTVPKPGEVSLAHNGVPWQQSWIDHFTSECKKPPVLSSMPRRGFGSG